MPNSDDDLLQQFVAGIDSAFSILVERYKRPLYVFIFQRVKNSELASDLTQDVFVQVFKSAASYRPEGKFNYWLFRIAHNLCIDAYRKQSRAQIVPLLPDAKDARGDDFGTWADPDDNANPANRMEQQETQNIIATTVAHLPAEQQQAFVLCQIHGLRYQEIAEIQKCPVGTVKSRVHQALTKIRSALQEKELL